MSDSLICILFVALNQHPNYPVIICANRDEFHHRPTQALHQWHAPAIIAGKDLQAGGTWLGINQPSSNIRETHLSHQASVRFSALTNYRRITPVQVSVSASSTPATHPKQSRGELVLTGLALNDEQTQHFLTENAANYEGFNLVYGELKINDTALTCFDSINQTFTHLTSGFHSICNGALDDIWPKMALGQSLLEEYITRHAELSIEHLFNLMQDNTTAPDHLLPQTGLPYEWEKRLSAIFITSPDYGTRSTCILTLDKHGELSIHQREFNPQSETINNITIMPS